MESDKAFKDKFKPYYRTIFKFSTAKKEGSTARAIDMIIRYKDANGVVNTVVQKTSSEALELIPWNSTIKLVVELQTLWIDIQVDKTLELGRKCGLRAVVKMIDVVERSVGTKREKTDYANLMDAVAENDELDDPAKHSTQIKILTKMLKNQLRANNKNLRVTKKKTTLHQQNLKK